MLCSQRRETPKTPVCVADGSLQPVLVGAHGTLMSVTTTAMLVLFASRLGLPVSTTHVSCGSIFGIGAVNRSARWQTISKILLTWVTTLPVAALISGLLYRLLQIGIPV
jgi:phosphate/sulfate permease